MIFLNWSCIRDQTLVTQISAYFTVGKKSGVGFTDMSKCLVPRSYITSKMFFQGLYTINTAAFSLDENEYI